MVPNPGLLVANNIRALPNNLSCSPVEVLPLGLIFIQQGKGSLYLLFILEAQAPSEQCGISHAMLWLEGEPGIISLV